MKVLKTKYILIGFFILCLFCCTVIIILRVKINTLNYLMDRKNIHMIDVTEKVERWESLTLDNIKNIGFDFSDKSIYNFNMVEEEITKLLGNSSKGFILLLTDLDNYNFDDHYNYINKYYKELFQGIPVKYLFSFENLKRQRFSTQNIIGPESSYFIDHKDIMNSGNNNCNLLYLDNNLKVVHSFGLSPESFIEVNLFFQAIKRYLNLSEQ